MPPTAIARNLTSAVGAGVAAQPTVGSPAALALENQRLRAELDALRQELRRSRTRLIEVADAERGRIARNLHDGAQQQLVAVALKLSMSRPRLASDPERASELIGEAVDDLMRTNDELRGLAIGAHPPALAVRGLRAALTDLTERSPLPVDLVAAPGGHFLPPRVESTVYFVVAEALTNVVKHAEASAATVSVTEHAGIVTVEIRDDGVGGADPNGGSGLLGLAERAAAMDGHLDVVDVVGGGTLVRATVSCESCA